MMHRAQLTRRLRLPSLAAACLALSTGCSGSVGDDGSPVTTGGTAGGFSPGTAGSSGASGPGAGGSGNVPPLGNGGSNSTAGTTSTPGGAGGGGVAAACLPGTDVAAPEVAAPKRLIRLTFNQIANSVRSLFGDAAATLITTKYQIGDATARTFPPLVSPREGSLISEDKWSKNDFIAKELGDYVLANFAAVTKCPAVATDVCAQQYITTLAERAYRRPLSEEDKTSLLQVYTATKTAGGSINEAVQYAVYAVLQSPHFLYRTEFGAGSMVAGELAPFELASHLSYFLTDGPPDQPLFDAAKAGSLSTPDAITAQVTRILATPTAKENFEQAMIAYYSLGGVLGVVIDPARAPAFNAGLANSMYRESELFIKEVLWNGKVNDFLTSRKATINAGLAALYGVTFPPAGATVTDGWATAELPDTRAGILTQAAFLTTKSRPDEPSVVGRALAVNAALLCAENPPFPDALAGVIDEASKTLEHQTENEKAAYRANTATCAGCHSNFDAYGLALQNFDIIGKFTTADSEGRPVNTTVTLPAAVGGATVQNAAQMAKSMAETGQFSTCMARNLLTFAMAEGAQVYPNSCSTQSIAQAYKTSDQSFSSMVRAVATSKAFTFRTAGGTSQ